MQHQPIQLNGAAAHPGQPADSPAGDASVSQASRLLQLYHNAAKLYIPDTPENEGVMMLVPITKWEEGRKEKAVARRIKIGDVGGMAEGAVGCADTSNVYFAPFLVKKGVPAGKRGKAKDIVAQLGLVIDDDGDNGKPAVLPPILPTAIVQTCERPTPNLHPHYVFTRPLAPPEAAALAELLHVKCGGDHGTKDIDHVWRVPGTLNHPNETKLKRGRPAEPQAVRLVGGTMQPVDPDDLRRALESMPDLAPAKKAKTGTTKQAAADATAETKTADVGALLKRCGKKLADLIRSEPASDRSKHSFIVVCRLFEKGLTDAEVAALACSPESFFAKKYVERGDLEAEIARVRVAWEQRKEVSAAGSANELDQMNNEFAVVKVGSKVRVMTLEERDGALIPSYMTLPDFKAFENKYRIEIVNDQTGELKKVGRGTWWLGHPERRQYKAVVFDPGASEERTRGKFNLWRGFSVKPREGDCSLYLQHITDIICSGNERARHVPARPHGSLRPVPWYAPRGGARPEGTGGHGQGEDDPLVRSALRPPLPASLQVRARCRQAQRAPAADAGAVRRRGAVPHRR